MSIDSSRWLVCWVIEAGNVFRVDSQDLVITIGHERVDSFENFVDLSISVPA